MILHYLAPRRSCLTRALMHLPVFQLQLTERRGREDAGGSVRCEGCAKHQADYMQLAGRPGCHLRARAIHGDLDGPGAD